MYIVKSILVEIVYVVPTSTNFAMYDFFQVPKIVLSGDPRYGERVNTSASVPYDNYAPRNCFALPLLKNLLYTVVTRPKG